MVGPFLRILLLGWNTAGGSTASLPRRPLRLHHSHGLGSHGLGLEVSDREAGLSRPGPRSGRIVEGALWGRLGQAAGMAPPRVVVVGAGVVGAALALRLAARGVPVTVVEADTPGGGTSASSFAWLNSNAKTPRAYHELNVAGMRAHHDLAAELAGGSASDAPWYRPVGTLEWAQGAAGRCELHSRVDRLRGWDYPVDLLTATDALGRQPNLRLPPGITEVVRFPSEGYVHSALLVDALLERARGLHATVRTGEAVVEVELAGRRVRGVRLRSGERVPADTVACCAGWRTPRLAAAPGVEVPLVRPEEPGSAATCLIVRVAGPVELRHVVRTPIVDLRPDIGRGLVAEHEEVNDGASLGMSPEEVAAGAAELLDRARRVLDGLDGMRAEARICVRPLPVDGLSIVGLAPSVDGCYLVVTHSGVTLAPHLAQLVARELVDGEEADELAPFRPGRFAPG